MEYICLIAHSQPARQPLTLQAQALRLRTQQDSLRPPGTWQKLTNYEGTLQAHLPSLGALRRRWQGQSLAATPSNEAVHQADRQPNGVPLLFFLLCLLSCSFARAELEVKRQVWRLGLGLLAIPPKEAAMCKHFKDSPEPVY